MYDTPKIIRSRDFKELKAAHVWREDGVDKVNLTFSLSPDREYAHSASAGEPEGHPVHGTPTHLLIEGPGAHRLIELLPEHAHLSMPKNALPLATGQEHTVSSEEEVASLAAESGSRLAELEAGVKEEEEAPSETGGIEPKEAKKSRRGK